MLHHTIYHFTIVKSTRKSIIINKLQKLLVFFIFPAELDKNMDTNVSSANKPLIDSI